MRQENSPFQPALRKPVDDKMLAGDPAADNFLAGSDGLSKRVTFDNVPPVVRQNGLSQPTTHEQLPQKDGNARINDLPASRNDDIFESFSSSADSQAQTAAPTPDKKSKKVHLPKFGRHKSHSNDAAKSAISAAAEAADNNAPQTPAVAGTNANAKLATKQTKQVTISALTIIFFVLFVISTACAIYFGIQNHGNSNKLSDAQAQIEELTAKSSENASSTNKQNNNFDALQDKITTLTKDNGDKQKTIDQLNKDKTDLNNKVNTLNGQVTSLQNKVNSDTQTSTDVKSLVTTLCTKDDFKSSSACVAASSSANQQNNQTNNQQSNQANTSVQAQNVNRQ